jgi:hypothetical protein
MMAFITRCWRKLCPPKPHSVWGASLRVLALAMLCNSGLWTGAWAQTAPSVELQGLRIERQEGALVLSGKWQYELSAPMQEALLKGIALHFVSEVDITRERWYFYDKRVARAERYMRLSYLPLTRRWRLNIANQPISVNGLGVILGQTFDSLEEATATMQRMTQWRIASQADIDADANHTLEMKFKLDLNQLPRPLQIGATGSNDWSLTFAKRMPLVVEPTR